MRVCVGYFLRRTWKDVESRRHCTLFAESHRIYPTREQAEDALDAERAKHHLDVRFTHDVAEAFMTIPDEEL